MNIVFFGSDYFAVPSLKEVLDSGHKILSVLTQPDKKSGRGFHLGQTQLKKAAVELGLNVYQPISVNSQNSIKYLKNLNADLFLVIAYGQLLSDEVLGIPDKLVINAHASLLPKYRGAAPINWAIIKGELQTGVTIIKVAKKMDSGPIIMQEEERIIPSDNDIMLTERLSKKAAKLVVKVIKLIEKQDYPLEKQNEEGASFAPKLKKSDGLIKWNYAALDIHNMVRGMYSWPGAFTHFQGKLIKLYDTEVYDYGKSSSSGEVLDVSKDRIIVGTPKGSLSIKELQVEGKKRVNAQSFLAGHKVKVGDIFG